MNLNDFVVLPNSKARSVKPNARNLQKLQMDTVTLASESKEMEDKLLQLRDNMSKEKEERRHSKELRWISGRPVPLPNSSGRNRDSKIQKLSAGKMKIRVLKDDSLTAPPQPRPSPAGSNVGFVMTRRSKVKEITKRCETEPAGLTDSLTHVSGQDASCFQEQIISDSFPSNFNPGSGKSSSSNHTSASNAITRRKDESPQKGTKVKGKLEKYLSDCSQEKMVIMEDDRKGWASPVLTGQYSEEESARSFQEALMKWRAERSGGAKQTRTMEEIQMPPKSVSAIVTQTDLPLDRDAEGQRGGEKERQAVKVEFTENNLTHMDRLLLKKHRRTPVESCGPSLAVAIDLKSLTRDTEEEEEEEEETSYCLNADEEDFHNYCASLLAVPNSSSKPEPQVSTPTPFIFIKVLEETPRDVKRDPAEPQKRQNRQIDTVQQSSRSEHSSSRHASFKADHFPLDSTQPPKQPVKPAKVHSSDNHNPKPKQSGKEFPSESKTSSYPISDNLGTSKKSVKTPTPQSCRPVGSHAIHKSKVHHGSPQLSSSLPHSRCEITNPSHSPDSLFTDVSVLDGNLSKIPKEYLSSCSSAGFPLRSTFTVSPSSSTLLDLLPKVYHSAPQQKGTDSSLLSQTAPSQLFAETSSSLEIREAPAGNLFFPQQSQDSTSDLQFLPSENQPTHSLSPVSFQLQPPVKSLEPVLSIVSPVPSHGSVYSNRMSDLKYRDDPVFVSSSSNFHKSILSHQDRRLLSNVINGPGKTDRIKEPSVDGGDEMSSDSLVLAPHEGDSSEADQLADAREQESKPLMVMQHQIAGSGSEWFCDVDEFSPSGLDMDAGHCDSPAYAHCDRFHACQLSVHGSDPTDGSCDVRDTAQLLVFVRGITDFKLTEERAAMRSMRGTTTGSDLFTEVNACMDTLGLKWERMSQPGVHCATFSLF
nr:uncharacterized protein zbbx isoform X3 [Nothobranchius furzeri]